MLGVMLAIGNYGFGDLLNKLESMGFFAYVLPFLVLFAMIYAVLIRINIFTENKGAAVLIAMAMGLLALQLGQVPAFFQAMSPVLAIALSLVLAALILAGAFITDEKAFKWIFFGIGAVAFIAVLISSLSSYQSISSDWWGQYGAIAVVFFFIIAAVVLIIVSSKVFYNGSISSKFMYKK